jgi:hypothetical protein
MKTKLSLKQENLDKKQSNLNRKKSIKANYQWPFDLKPNTIKKTLGFIILLITMLPSNPIFAQIVQADSNQGILVKGTVSDDDGPLLGVNIIQKGAEIGTTTDIDGVFIFPKALKPDDILIFSYLGYETQEVVITKNTTILKVILTLDAVVMGGALEVDKPYKSKRSH